MAPRWLRHIAGGLALLLAGATTAAAQGTAAPADAVVRTDNVTAELVAEAAQARPGDSVAILLQQTIRAHWHTYWKNPGDSGQETAIDWTLPAGASAGPIQWPAPERIEYGPLVNYGYSNKAGLVSDVTVPADWPAGQPFPVRAHATWLVCEQICIPEEGTFALDIETGPETIPNSGAALLFKAARRSQPTAAPWPVSYAIDGDRLTLAIAAPDLAAARLSEVYFFPAAWGVVNHAAPQALARTDTGIVITVPRGETAASGDLGGVLTLVDAANGNARLAFAVQAVPGAVPATGPAAAGMPVAMILLLAFAGGVLLNLMPCVFPVLAIKALGLVQGAGGSPLHRLGGGLVYTAGVLVSFAALGAALLALQAGGAAVGWGFQLQHPLVVALFAYVLFGVGLNLAGVFEVGGGWTGLGQALAGRQGLAGSFFTGVLAAVVAAPCTAPFMATALGFAFTQPPAVAMAAVLALGAGLAAPYLLLTAAPPVARLLPKPGAWMATFKQVLAFPMFASAAWLVWVLAQQASPDAVFACLLGMVVLAAAAWLLGKPGRVARGLAAAALVAALWLAALIQPASAPVAADPQSFSQARFAALRAEKQPVLLNLTAAWCITCKVNERVALSGDSFQAALTRNNVTYLVGDWTRQDAEITAMLRRFDRAGVPLYVLFYPDDRPPTVLPQILTEDAVVNALDAIGPPKVGSSVPEPRKGKST